MPGACGRPAAPDLGAGERKLGSRFIVHRIARSIGRPSLQRCLRQRDSREHRPLSRARLLGEGGFGRVYLARDDSLTRVVAIKMPNPARIDRPADVEANLKEARNLATLDHPHIVPVCDADRTDDGLCYVVSKYIEGSDLATRNKRARPSFRESAELAAMIALALHHALRAAWSTATSSRQTS